MAKYANSADTMDFVMEKVCMECYPGFRMEETHEEGSFRVINPNDGEVFTQGVCREDAATAAATGMEDRFFWCPEIPGCQVCHEENVWFEVATANPPCAAQSHCMVKECVACEFERELVNGECIYSSDYTACPAEIPNCQTCYNSPVHSM